MRPVRRTQKPKRRYRYEDRNGRYITDSDITPDDCERPCESGPAGSDSSFRTAVAAHRPKQFSPPPAFFDGKIWRESEFLFTFALPKGSVTTSCIGCRVRRRRIPRLRRRIRMRDYRTMGRYGSPGTAEMLSAEIIKRKLQL